MVKRVWLSFCKWCSPIVVVFFNENMLRKVVLVLYRLEQEGMHSSTGHWPICAVHTVLSIITQVNSLTWPLYSDLFFQGEESPARTHRLPSMVMLLGRSFIDIINCDQWRASCFYFFSFKVSLWTYFTEFKEKRGDWL